ncbi:hypothetical protein GPLA_0094 [Paraglaciecola polaris LMG 21857]|uniref:Uncharacterized protein n=1 Tax=Paraglaciecola polaris LMG 21857 TaxID=1129793 RepID=K7A6B5_9ALTE|nr:hypothetical protein GPLA_0094 [Paraglaciecola polaris LMG 21857]
MAPAFFITISPLHLNACATHSLFSFPVATITILLNPLWC